MAFPIDIPATLSGWDMGSNSARGDFGFEYAGNQYLFLLQDGGGAPFGDHKVHALRSVDGGNTWTDKGSVGPAAVPAFGNAYTLARDGSNVVLVYVRATGGPVTLVGLSSVVFNLVTETWGVATDYAAPVLDFEQKDTPGDTSRGVLIRLVVRGASDYVLYYSGPTQVSGVTGNKLGRVYYAAFNGAAFGAGVQLPNQAGSARYFMPIGACVDSAGNTHFTYIDNTPGAIGFNVYHVAMDGSGVFGATQTVTTQGYLFGSPETFSEPIVWGAFIGFAAFINDNPASTTQSIRLYYAAAPGLAPAWSNSIITSDQAHLIVLQAFFIIGMCLSLNDTAGKLHVFWTWSDGSSNGFYYFSVSADTPTFAWSAAAQLFAVSIGFYPSCQVFSFSMAGGVGIVGAAATPFLPNVDSEVAQFYLYPEANPVVVPVSNPPRGGSYPVPQPFNDFDMCLAEMRAEWPRICRLICPKPHPWLSSYEWDEEEGIPEQARQFSQTNGILTPVPAAGDVVVVRFRVPNGYDGTILQMYNLYTGTGFVQGSGDIVWRIRINRYYSRDWGNLPYMLGSTVTPMPLNDAIFLQSGQLVQLLVNVPNISGLIQVGASLILGGLKGFFYPR